MPKPTDWEVRTEHHYGEGQHYEQNCLHGTAFDELVLGGVGKTCWLHIEALSERGFYIGLYGKDDTQTQLYIHLDENGLVDGIGTGSVDHLPKCITSSKP